MNKLKSVISCFLIVLGGECIARSPNETLNGCIQEAAIFHQVNEAILTSILKVESSFRGDAINKNANGTMDVGIGQINSIHFKKLAQFNITPGDLLDPCVGTYVSAWHLSKQIKSYGNTWFAVGAYHSVSPYFNNRYQRLVYNAMIDLKVLAGRKLPVPPMINQNTSKDSQKSRLTKNESAIIAISH